MGLTAVMEKTVPRWNRRIMCANRPLYVGTSFVVMYILRYKSADVNILGHTDSIHIFGEPDVKRAAKE